MTMSSKKNELIENLRSELERSPARDLLYDFMLACTKYSYEGHTYLSGIGITSMEAHILKHICQNPGVTISDIVSYWGRTKGTVSAQISNLEQKGLVKREPYPFNRKKMGIYPTENGLEMNKRHILYDMEESKAFIEKWFEKYPPEDFLDFFEKLNFYKDFLNSRVKNL